MDKLAHIRGMLFLGLFCVAKEAQSASNSVPVQVNDFVIPPIFANALQQGMNVPVFVRYRGDELTQRSRQKIADAMISIKDGSFVINQITISELPDNTELSPQLKSLLGGLNNKSLNGSNSLSLGEDASLTLDIKSFYLELTVDRTAMAAALIPRTNILPESSVSDISNVMNYTIGSYYNSFKEGHSSSNYITLDNTASLREHHLNINGSIYGVGTSNDRGQLYRAMYERDFLNRRFAIGMMDTWNMQSIASMSALNSSRIYGMSYGNKSNTEIADTTLSLIPITVFLPSAGEVHVYRQGRLLSIQNFQMGNFEIDTSRLPFGIYDIEIEVIVNGNTVSSRTAQINKSFARKSSVTDNLDWQIFSGALRYSKIDYRGHDNLNYGEKQTWLAGISAATNQPWLAGTSIKSTLYGFDNNGVYEGEANVAVNDTISASQQVMAGTDKSWRSISTLNLSLPSGYGSIWGSREYTHVGNSLPIQKGDYFSIGSTVNLQRFSPYLGTLTVSRTDNRYHKNKYTNVDYNQSLYSGRRASINLRAGVQRYDYDDRTGLRDKYINLDFSFPLSTWFSAGVSSENGNVRAVASLRKGFDDSTITQVGATVSKRISQNDENSYRAENYSANGYLSYDAKYNAGTLAMSRSSNSNSTVSYSSAGSVALVKDNIALGSGRQQSGVMVNTNFTEQGKMIAQINGQNYPLTGKSNFISLPPYAEYSIELMNDKKSEHSVDIVSGRRSQVVLYPGNVGVINPEIKQLVTVFGRVKKTDGGSVSNVNIYNHIGKTKTDSYGEFAIDVDKRYPSVTVVDGNGKKCEANLDLRNARGAIWVGDIYCNA